MSHVLSLWPHLSVLVVTLALDLASAGAAAQGRCQQVRFAPGASSGVIEGEIPPDAQLCYTIEVGNGQRARATIEGPEAQFPVMMIDGITRDGGDQTVNWVTRAGIYEIFVSTLFRYGANTPFRVKVSVTD